MSTVSEMLRAEGACFRAVEWAADYGDPQAAWEACSSVAWLCWWIDRVHCGDTPTRHLLIADLAEPVLPIYERHFPGDTRVRDAIEARRAYARGEITQDQWVASLDAAWAASRAAALAAADAASEAAWAAAWQSAGAAAGAAARASAVDASWGWQRAIILRHYPTPPTREVAR